MLRGNLHEHVDCAGKLCSLVVVSRVGGQRVARMNGDRAGITEMPMSQRNTIKSGDYRLVTT